MINIIATILIIVLIVLIIQLILVIKKLQSLIKLILNAQQSVTSLQIKTIESIKNSN